MEGHNFESTRGSTKQIGKETSLPESSGKDMVKRKKEQGTLEMEKIEGGLDDLFRLKAQGMQIEDYEYKVRILEDDRKKKLLEEEERWRQKSRAIWITSGDKNTKFFHRFASFRRNKKHIWEIEDESGRTHSNLRT
jgi:hypothetical protein